MRAWLAIGAVLVIGAAAAWLVLRSPGDAPSATSASPSDAASPLGAHDDTAAYHASQLVTDARREAAAGRLPEAHALLVQAQAQDPQPATLLELARLEDRLGRCREAKRSAQRVLAAAPTGPSADQARQLLARLGHCD
jgi:hypothetical protein